MRIKNSLQLRDMLVHGELPNFSDKDNRMIYSTKHCKDLLCGDCATLRVSEVEHVDS